jgi:RNA polymerase sigma factor (sigma-70 family)
MIERGFDSGAGGVSGEAFPELSETIPQEADERRAWFRLRILPLEPVLRSYVRRILPDNSDVDDIVHDTFVKIIGLSTWRDVATPTAFVKTVARNLVHDLFRHRSVVPIYNVADLEATNAVDELANPELTNSGRDELRFLAHLVENLPPQCQKVFTLRKVHGFSNDAIAKQLGLSVSTVEKHLVKALRLCSEGLARREGDNLNWQAHDRRRNRSKRGSEY